jgi:HD-GYP domain-containing protein (c-di-GMP phosphodiesterase class II)
MMSHRPYRPALGIDAAMDEIRKNSGRLYNHEIAEACLDLFERDGYQIEEETNINFPI